MRRLSSTLVIVLALISILLSACAPGSAAPSSNPQTTDQPVSQKPGAQPAGSIQINGAGATFPLPIYAEWTYAYQYVDPSVVINYQGTGSGGGKKAMIDGTVDFAGSDSFLTDEEYAAGKDLQMIPVLAGAVVPVYNIAGLSAEDPALVLDGKTLVGIYNATITRWNDPAILALNPGLKGKLPDQGIVAVHRADGSGTTEVFTKALTSFSPEWTAGGAASIEWPVDQAGNGIGGKGNPGVAAAIQNTANSIGYVELSYALQNKIPTAQMVNKAGQTVTANAASLQAAMTDFSDKFSARLTNTIVDAPGAGSWPISAYTYVILHTSSMTDCAKAQKLLEYLRWTLTDPSAAKRAAELGYAVLPETVQKTVLAKLGEVTCGGAPVLKAQ